jgi:predicted nucleic acid-binding protein
MRDNIFFDTNILVYGFDNTDQRKYAIASDLIIQAYQKGNGVLSTQVLKEFFVTVTQKISRKMPLDSAEQAIRDFALWRVVETSVSLILKAITFHRQHNLSFWDAMIVAAAKVSNCATLFTEDLPHDSKIENVHIVNPFAED